MATQMFKWNGKNQGPSADTYVIKHLITAVTRQIFEKSWKELSFCHKLKSSDPNIFAI